jgi:flavin-dependent dehydrogenase
VLNKVVKGVVIKTKQGESEYQAPVVVDATGRTRRLARRVENTRTRKPSLVAFKAHLIYTRSDSQACEIYFYKGGYGGLNAIEGEVSNLCFIVSADDAKRCESNPDLVLSQIVCRNSRAAFALQHSRAVTPWLAVTLEHFGVHSLVPAEGLLAAGDAAAFIDPFTGSGMLMALQSGALVAAAIITEHRQARFSFHSLANNYRDEYRRHFFWRLRSCAILRTAAFAPWLTEAAMFLSSNDRLRQFLARATRVGGPDRTTVVALNS